MLLLLWFVIFLEEYHINYDFEAIIIELPSKSILLRYK
jgi:hypothetical protein